MSADDERARWEERFDVGVGPLRFGMSPAEVEAALGVSEPETRVGGHTSKRTFRTE